MASRLDDLNSRVASELDTLNSLNSRMAAIGQLSLLEFCLGLTVSCQASYVYVLGSAERTSDSRRIWRRVLRLRSLSPRRA
jgi:hypothetical protein